MKFLHLADLHFGKCLHNASMIENGDQVFWVEQILKLVDQEKPDAVVIAGDVYDRGVPPREAVTLLSSFLTELAGDKRNIPVLMIAGNHDGGERLDFASQLLAEKKVYIAGVANREMTHVTIGEGNDAVTFWLMPYIFPVKVRDVLQAEDEEITDYESAARRLLQEQEIDFTKKNVLVAHQFVVSGTVEPETSDSEMSVGGTGAMDCRIFDGFDYVALGHIHNSQSIGRSSIRYAGAPLCYHFSEVGQRKDALFVTINDKGTEPTYEFHHVPELHKMRCIKGEFAEIVEKEKLCEARNEYVSVTITDEKPIYNAADTLRALFESHGTKMLDIVFEPRRSGTIQNSDSKELQEKSLEEMFSDFYADRNGRVMDEKELELIGFLAHQIGNDADVHSEEIVNQLIRMAMNQEERT